MATKVASLIAEVGADLRPLSSGLGRAQSEIKSAGREIEGSLSGIADVASELQPVGVALAGISAAGSALVISSTATAARVEELGLVLQTVGHTAGYSESEIAGFEAGVQEMGITTQASRQALVQMAQANIDFAHATDLARLAQDAAVIAHLDSSQAFEKLITVIQTGNIRMARNMGLVVDFQGAYERMADQLGVTTLELTQQQKVQARVNEVFRAGAAITGTYEAAMNAAGKRLRSMNRHFEEAKVALGEAWLPAMTKGVDAATGMLKAFNALTPAQKRTTSAFIGITTAVTGAAGGLILLAPRVVATVEALGTLKAMASGANVALGGLAGSAGGVAGMLGAVAAPAALAAAGIATLYTVSSKYVESLDESARMFMEQEDAFRRMGKGATEAARAEYQLSKAAQEAGESASNLADGWTGQYSPALEHARQLTDGWATSLGNATAVLGPNTEALGANAAAAGGAAEAQQGLATAASTVAAKFGEMTFDNEMLWNLAMASGASAEQLGVLAQQLGIATEAEVQNTIKAYELIEAYGAGAISAGQLRAGFEGLGAATAMATNQTNANIAANATLRETMGGAAGVARDFTGALHATSKAAQGVSGDAGGAAASCRNLAGAANSAASAIRSIPSSHTFTLHYNIDMPAGVAPGLQHGTPYVPETGLYLLHRGEAVVPANRAQQMRGRRRPRPFAAGGLGGGGGGTMINININEPLTVRDDRDVDRIADAIARRIRLRGGYRSLALG